MGISKNGKLSRHDVYESPRQIEQYMHTKGTVLELAMGKGKNSEYLAQRFPHAEIHGIDFCEPNVNCAQRRARHLHNFFPSLGDYHDLKRYPSNKFDIVFIIEALCHSNHKAKVFKEVHRLLKRDGVFIVVDGYYDKKRINSDERRAQILTARAMAVDVFESYNRVRQYAKKERFRVVDEKNFSQLILPTLHKFERESRIFLASAFIARALVRVFPKEFTYNIVAGYLMPDLVIAGCASYRFSVFKKV